MELVSFSVDMSHTTSKILRKFFIAVKDNRDKCGKHKNNLFLFVLKKHGTTTMQVFMAKLSSPISVVITSGYNLFAGWPKQNGMLKLGYITAFNITERRIGLP